MYAVIFKAKISEPDDTYDAIATQLRQLAKTKYGCIDFISVSDGTHEIAISYWENLSQIAAWKDDPTHRDAQQLGRTKWYQSYEVEIVKILGPVHTNSIGTVAPEKAPIETRGEKFGESK